jgi:hypothetical protein
MAPKSEPGLLSRNWASSASTKVGDCEDSAASGGVRLLMAPRSEPGLLSRNWASSASRKVGDCKD